MARNKIMEKITSDLERHLSGNKKLNGVAKHNLVALIDTFASTAKETGKYSETKNENDDILSETWDLKLGNLNVRYTEATPIDYWMDFNGDQHEYRSFKTNFYLDIKNEKSGYSISASLPYYTRGKQEVIKDMGIKMKYNRWNVSEIKII